ncbi:aspartic proteinase precursor [Amylocarpus encephaloides]|uniref:Aspartic proteinase n=1 Tax=Amylocarpus encephaloides TaxID=45428 RepID=A0A9P7YV43_9HELO|nr:aspartic proteinase precursor [Amylocarpus encephaloides]
MNPFYPCYLSPLQSTTLIKDLQKVHITTNPNYKKSGTNSYVYLFNKWGFEPTKPGPYFQLSVPAEEGHQQPYFHHLDLAFWPRRQVLERLTMRRQLPNMARHYCLISTQDLLISGPIGIPGLVYQAAKNVQSPLGHTVFDSSMSSSYSQSSSSSWKISYGDNSLASGIVGTDKIDLGGLIVNNQAVELASILSPQLVRGHGDGFLGLAFGKINTVRPTAVPTPVENMISQNGIPKSAQLFTAKLGSWRDEDEPDKGAGFYTFGFIDEPTVAASAQQIAWTPIDNRSGFWQLASRFTIVNGRVIIQSRGTAIADTGTTLALVSDYVCEVIYSAIPGSSYDEDNQGYVYPTSVTLDELPNVIVAVGNTQITIQEEDLGFANIGNGTIYGGLHSRGTLPFGILGDTFSKCIYAASPAALLTDSQARKQLPQIFDQGNMRLVVQRPEQNQNISVPLP